MTREIPLPSGHVALVDDDDFAPIDTARHWLYRHFNEAQRKELAKELLKEMDEQEPGRSSLRRTLAAWASEE